MLKSRNVTMELVVTDQAEEFRPGSCVPFSVYIHIKKPIKVSLFRVRFLSEGYCVQPELRPGSVVREMSMAPLPDPRFTTRRCFGTCYVQPAIHADSRDGTSRPHGRSSLSRLEPQGDVLVPYLDTSMSQFSSTGEIKLPLNIPDTWKYSTSYTSLKISNDLIATLSYSVIRPGQDEKEKEVECRVPIRIRNLVPVESMGEHESVREGSEAYVGGILRIPRGMIRCKLTVHDHLAVVGQDLPISVLVQNDSTRTILRVRLSLFRECTCRVQVGPGSQVIPVRKEHKIFSVPLPCPAAKTTWHRHIDRFTIPSHCLPTSCLKYSRFVRFRYFVRLSVSWVLGSVESDVTVYLGNVTNLPALPLPDVLERHEILL